MGHKFPNDGGGCANGWIGTRAVYGAGDILLRADTAWIFVGKIVHDLMHDERRFGFTAVMVTMNSEIVAFPTGGDELKAGLRRGHGR